MGTAGDRLPPVDFPARLFEGPLERFPIADALVRLLSRSERPEAVPLLSDGRLADALAAAYGGGDDEAREDVQRALFAIYETSFANPLAAACRHEHAPWLCSLREAIEQAWLEHDEALLTLPSREECERMGPAGAQEWFLHAAAEQSPLDREVVGHLEHDATLADMKAFVCADAHLNYRFYDALVLALVHYLEPVKTEISEHFWEEAGEGAVERSHTRQFTRSLERLGLVQDSVPTWDDWRPYAGHNLYFALGLSRRHYFKALGSLAMPELFDVDRDQAIVNGLRRLGFDPQHDFEYYWNHVEADAEHGPGWLTGVVLPIVEAQPAATHELITGAALRMQAMGRFNAYLADRFRMQPMLAS